MAMAQNITFIPAVKTVGTQKPAEKKQKVRVAALICSLYERQ